MPRASRICNKQGCSEITTTTYCEAHQLPAWQKTTPRKHVPGWARIRTHILYRDNNTCQRCGNPATEVDHITPLSWGGNSKPSNLQALCTPCNKTKNYEQRKQTPPNR